jgi:CDP-diacylglycerol--glycerol-3-phosphate 3-phosphatidyltransferase
MSILNIPTLLTLLRLIALPVLIWSMAFGFVWVAFWIYMVGAISDYFDGYLARKLNQVTAFGTFLDPIADKIYVAAIFVTLVAMDTLNGLWIIPVILILSRELIVSGLREFMGPRHVTFPVSKLAKWKTAAQMAALAFLILSPLHLGYFVAGAVLLLGATALTLVTGWDYLKTGLAHMENMD